MRSCRLSELIRGLQNLEAPFGKVLILFVRSRHCGELNRGSQNLEKFQKDLILFVRDSCLGADSRFAEPRFSRQGIRLVTFCVVQKVTKKHVLGRAKSCLWQVFVRRRPPKQGELRTDVSKATMFQGDRGLRPSGLPGTIQISARYGVLS